jgi:hypothetical protein
LGVGSTFDGALWGDGPAVTVAVTMAPHVTLARNPKRSVGTTQPVDGVDLAVDRAPPQRPLTTGHAAVALTLSGGSAASDTSLP